MPNENQTQRDRPTWDEYFLSLAFHAAIRSEDPDIQHGAIIVNSSNHILGTGYNGPIKGSDNTRIPMRIRDKKRLYMIHAEENAILNTIIRQPNTRIYVTGKVCCSCLQRIINFGIERIIMTDRVGTITNETPEAREMFNNLVDMSGIKIDLIPTTNRWISRWIL